MFFEKGFPEVMSSSVSIINSIVLSFCQISDAPDRYALGDFFAHLWCLRILSSKRGNAQLTEDIDNVLNTKPEPLNDEQWRQARQAIELRRDQLMDRLEDRFDYPVGDDSESTLRRILNEAE